jgi:hypothetical protein
MYIMYKAPAALCDSVTDPMVDLLSFDSDSDVDIIETTPVERHFNNIFDSIPAKQTTTKKIKRYNETQCSSHTQLTSFVCTSLVSHTERNHDTLVSSRSSDARSFSHKIESEYDKSKGCSRYTNENNRIGETETQIKKKSKREG